MPTNTSHRDSCPTSPSQTTLPPAHCPNHRPADATPSRLSCPPDHHPSPVCPRQDASTPPRNSSQPMVPNSRPLAVLFTPFPRPFCRPSAPPSRSASRSSHGQAHAGRVACPQDLQKPRGRVSPGRQKTDWPAPASSANWPPQARQSPFEDAGPEGRASRAAMRRSR